MITDGLVRFGTQSTPERHTSSRYDARVERKRLHIRLTAQQMRLVDKYCKKFQMDRSAVLGLAIVRLDQVESVLEGGLVAQKLGGKPQT